MYSDHPNAEQIHAQLSELRRDVEARGAAELDVLATPDLLRVVRHAQKIATVRRQPIVHEHFIFALAGDPEGRRVLQACGADVERTQRELAQFLDRPVSQVWSVFWAIAVLYGRAHAMEAQNANFQLSTGGMLVAIMAVAGHGGGGFGTGLLADQGVSLLRVREYVAHGCISVDETPELPKAVLLGGPGPVDRARYRLIMHDDDFTTREFITKLLEGTFKKSKAEAAALVTEAHETRRAVIGSFELPQALAHMSRATELARAAQFPLKITLEPEPR